MPRKQHYPCMTHVRTRGNFYDVGYNVGVSFSEQIKYFFTESDSHQKLLLPFYDSQAGRDYFEESLRVCQACFPQYVQEVRGTADGAGLPFEQVFMANVFERRLASTPCKPGQLENESKTDSRDAVLSAKSTDEFGCTTLFISTQNNTRLLLHNEDSSSLVKDCGYLLSAEIEEDGQREEFTAFCYPGCLPGRAFNFNVHGLVLTSNALYPAEVVKGAPSRVFITRSLLKARDVQDAVRLAKNAPFGAAYGFTVNISTNAGKMTSLEVGPGKPQALVHAHDVKQQNDPDVPCHYYHFNAYKHLEVTEVEGLHSSIRRSQRTSSLLSPRSLHEALEIMADTHDPLGPIFRTPRLSDDGETICTAVFDVAARQVSLFQGREDLLSNSPFLRLPMYS